MTRGATLFSGGRGVEAMLGDAVDFALACEYDADIAAVGAQLGGHTIVGDVCEQDFTQWGALDYLHASPVCTNASQAKKDGTEDTADIAAADAVVRCLEATQPRVFTLENVQGYVHFEAYWRICRALDRLGYFWHAETLNAANYGVPQTRRRLILRAVRDALLPCLPTPESWVGWYGAIEDLIPTLPESAFAPWQLARLGEMDGSFLMRGANTQQQWGDGARSAIAPAYTVTTDSPPRAFVVEGSAAGLDNKFSLPVRDQDEPIFTMRAHQNPPRAFIVGGQYETPNTSAVRRVAERAAQEPIWTITASEHGDTRAWLVQGTSTLDVRRDSQPSAVVVATVHTKAAVPRAFLIGGGNTNATVIDSKPRDEDDPAFTITHASVRDRAWLAAGRVVKMTPRALARFQSLPDWYVLPDKNSLACKIVGNAVPSLLMRKIVLPLLGKDFR